ncbi:MAG: polysaccharide biosynthesis/export family protein [Gammaproteobacteria bacterium]|nr:polysaccharide biosynthesis/export family protein [Gammaproteobacteria bacterium]
MLRTLILLVFGLLQATTAWADYLLGAGDKVKIVVYAEPELSLETRVDSVGFISYPFIGSLQLKDRTVSQVKQQIVEGLRGDYLINPEVTVTVQEYRLFFVNGRVRKPGGFAYQPGMTVQKSISLAGGFDARADKDDIYLTRGEGAESVKTTPDTLIQPGDVITVERSFF